MSKAGSLDRRISAHPAHIFDPVAVVATETQLIDPDALYG
jgi:hypothetical protein